jgi:hypothetical protein
MTVIAGFPGIGKSHWFDGLHLSPAVELDGSNYKYQDGDTSRIDPKWPQNYIEKITGHLDRNLSGTILISSYPEVIRALINRGTPVTIVYPGPGQKEDYLERYRKRGNTEEFQAVMKANFDLFISTLSTFTECRQIVLLPGEYLSDVILGII